MSADKLIIHLGPGVSEITGLKAVLRVAEMGRVSRARGRDQFCFVSTFDFGEQSYLVYAMEKRNDKTDSFKVRVEKNEKG